MAQDPEKKFHSIMDKLFHAPKSSPPSSSSSGAQSLRGKKRPNPSFALLPSEPKARADVIEGSKRSSAPAGSCQAPLCRPWDRGDLMRRAATFKSMTWFAKPKVINAVNCARKGWVNVDMDIIACESCGAYLLFSTPPSWSQEQVEKAALVLSLKLDSGHKLLCPWIDNACDEKLAEFPPATPAALVDKFRERSSALSQLLALPVISSSAIEYMRGPQLEEYLLRQHLTQYYQALRIISLCGWEPRSLPYVVDCKDGPNHFVKDADILNASQAVANRQNLSENSMDPSGLQCDPNSVVLDCRLCGASVGLWAFTTVPRPLDVFRVVGSIEVNPDHASGHENNADDRNLAVNIVANVGPSSKDRFPKLNLTIAGGPPPTKQNFKATISLPVIGRNLMSRFSYDSEFRDWVNSQEDTRGHCYMSFKDTGITEEESSPGAGTLNSILEGLKESVQNVAKGSGQSSRPENEENAESIHSVVKDTGTLQVGDSSVITQEVSISSKNSGTSGNGSSLMVSSDSLHLQQITERDKVWNKEISLDNHKESPLVEFSLESNVNVDVSSKMNGREDKTVGEQTAENHNVMACNAGKDQKKPPCDRVMEFDPIRQHRHFCPWIAPTGSTAPGWQQTLSALLRQKDFSHSSPTSSPSSTALIKVDDPVASVKRLFMTPTAKRMKSTPESS